MPYWDHKRKETQYSLRLFSFIIQILLQSLCDSTEGA